MGVILPPRGLYAITDAALCATPGMAACVSAALCGGAVMIQYRDKSGDDSRRLREARELQMLCSQAAVPFIVNDDVELALAVGADGVHLGTDDAGILDARKRLGPDAIIGASCYASLDIALQAQSASADYVGFGSFYASPTKPLAVRASPELLREARTRLRLPIAAIGGITSANGRELIEAGAGLLAVVSGVFGTDDVEASARALSELFN